MSYIHWHPFCRGGHLPHSIIQIPDYCSPFRHTPVFSFLQYSISNSSLKQEKVVTFLRYNFTPLKCRPIFNALCGAFSASHTGRFDLAFMLLILFSCEADRLKHRRSGQSLSNKRWLFPSLLLMVTHSQWIPG